MNALKLRLFRLNSFKKTPYSDSPDGKQVFASEGWRQVKTRLEFLTQHPGAGLLSGEVGAGKSTAAHVLAASLNPNLHKILYIHFSNGSTLDLLRQIAFALDLLALVQAHDGGGDLPHQRSLSGTGSRNLVERG